MIPGLLDNYLLSALVWGFPSLGEDVQGESSDAAEESLESRDGTRDRLGLLDSRDVLRDDEPAPLGPHPEPAHTLLEVVAAVRRGEPIGDGTHSAPQRRAHDAKRRSVHCGLL